MMYHFYRKKQYSYFCKLSGTIVSVTAYEWWLHLSLANTKPFSLITIKRYLFSLEYYKEIMFLRLLVTVSATELITASKSIKK